MSQIAASHYRQQGMRYLPAMYVCAHMCAMYGMHALLSVYERYAAMYACAHMCAMYGMYALLSVY